MIRLAHITVRGECTDGPFAGTLELSKGLQVISADNAFGKSLAVKSVAWCLGVEPIFGIFSNDATCFPQAVLERLQLQDGTSSEVQSSECEIGIVHEDGRKLQITRAIRGDTSTVFVREEAEGQPVRESKLLARRATMQDETGVGGGEKGYQFSGREGARCGVTLWPAVGRRKREEADCFLSQAGLSSLLTSGVR
jgi:hypothetical protein